MILSVYRDLLPEGNCRFGNLFVNGVRECFTLENEEFLFPPGTYKAKTYYSPHNKRLVILLLDVPGRTSIEIHIANFPIQLKGCIAVGIVKTDKQLIDSRIAFESLMSKVLLDEDNLEVEVIE